MQTVTYILVALLPFVVVGLILWNVGLSKFRARAQHYVFAHRLLPEELFADPKAILAPLVSGSSGTDAGKEHLLKLWKASSEGLEAKYHLPPETLAYSQEDFEDAKAILINMPPAEKKPEAIHLLIVFDPAGLSGSAPLRLRYFALEYAGIVGGAHQALLTEWSPDDEGGLKHTTHREAVGPFADDFLKATQEILKEPVADS